METVQAISTAFGASWASGINLYCTVFVLGALSHLGVTLPGKMAVVGDWRIMLVAAVLYAAEFVADKVPWFDSMWDSVHTFIRIPAAAGLAATTLSADGATAEVAIALLGAGAAASSHATKAATRVVANGSPEPFSNWILSVVEDVIAFVMAVLSALLPIVAGVLALLGVCVSTFVLIKVGRVALRVWRRRSVRATGPGRAP